MMARRMESLKLQKKGTCIGSHTHTLPPIMIHIKAPVLHHHTRPALVHVRVARDRRFDQPFRVVFDDDAVLAELLL